MNKSRFERITGKIPIHFIKEKLDIKSKYNDSDNPISSTQLYKQIISLAKDTNLSKKTKPTTINQKINLTFYTCVQCNTHHLESDKQSHLSSLSHQLLDPVQIIVPVSYPVSSTNPGYKILSKDGWDIGRGLGKDESGMIYPVATTLKNDRLGLGVVKGKRKRITHTDTDLNSLTVTTTDLCSRKDCIRIQEAKEMRRRALLFHLKS